MEIKRFDRYAITAWPTDIKVIEDVKLLAVFGNKRKAVKAFKDEWDRWDPAHYPEEHQNLMLKDMRTEAILYMVMDPDYMARVLLENVIKGYDGPGRRLFYDKGLVK